MSACSQCRCAIDSPAAILAHNRLVAETGERSYQAGTHRPIRTAPRAPQYRTVLAFTTAVDRMVARVLR